MRGEYLGTLSERDCCNAVAEYGAEAPMMHVADIVNRTVPTCSVQDGLPVVMAIMTKLRTRHVLIMDGDAVVGVVSIGDVVKHRLEKLCTTSSSCTTTLPRSAITDDGGSGHWRRLERATGLSGSARAEIHGCYPGSRDRTNLPHRVHPLNLHRAWIFAPPH